MKDNNKIVKTYFAKTIDIDNDDYTVKAIISDESIDRYGDVIKLDAWAKSLDTFMKHPVLVSSHNYGKLIYNIGIIKNLEIDPEKGLVATMKYFVGEGNDEADWGFFLAKNGVAAYSVGFRPKPKGTITNDWDDEDVRAGKKPYRIFTDVELLEVSQVIVPANANALQESIKNIEDFVVKSYSEKVLDFIKVKTGIPHKKYQLADKETTWDAGKEVKKATVDDLKEMCAVIVGDPENKGSYKLPHHTVDGYKTVWRGVTNATVRLTATKMPEEDVPKVKEHLGKHYKDFGEAPPWEKNKDLWDKFETTGLSEITKEDFIELFGDTDLYEELVMKIESTENYHHIPVRDVKDFIKDTLRTITLSEKKGIKAVVGKLKDGGNSMVIQKYLFDVEKWTLKEATDWVKEKEGKKELEEVILEETEFEDELTRLDEIEDVVEEEIVTDGKTEDDIETKEDDEEDVLSFEVKVIDRLDRIIELLDEIAPKLDEEIDVESLASVFAKFQKEEKKEEKKTDTFDKIFSTIQEDLKEIDTILTYNRKS